MRRGIVFRALLCAALFAPCAPATAANGSVVYTYDALGRVTTASYDTGVIVIYTYDANGNRTQQVVNVNTATLCWTNTGGPCAALPNKIATWGRDCGIESLPSQVHICSRIC